MGFAGGDEPQAKPILFVTIQFNFCFIEKYGKVV